MHSSLRRSLLLVTVVGLAACVNQIKPIAPLNYDHIAPLYVAAGQIDVANHFHPTPESDKAVAAFPIRPDDALTHYAQNRLKTKGYEGTLHFIIEDATVKKSVMPADNKVLKWANLGVQDRYDVTIDVALSRTEGNGNSSGDAHIQVDRFITVPQNYSVAKRQDTLREFTSNMIQQVDGMVTSTLQDRMHMTVSEDGGAPVSSASDNDGMQTGPKVESLPVAPVKPEALPPPW